MYSPTFRTSSQNAPLLLQLRSFFFSGAFLTMLFAVLAVAPETACAQGAPAGMPWISGLCSVAKLMTGPIAGAISIIALATMGILYMIGEEKTVMSAGGRILIGMSIIFFAGSIIEYFMGGGVSAFMCK